MRPFQGDFEAATTRGQAWLRRSAPLPKVRPEARMLRVTGIVTVLVVEALEVAAVIFDHALHRPGRSSRFHFRQARETSRIESSGIA
ncbi:hypothetical protein [Ensifer sesbaniae]|jgi:hypothetical protein|uniref:hypothetical protein n=1 Tax=Ensifer sesbaniae TaxID=1214071 RepID=UPI00156894C3|nr:hypothetical protein [Ensifer sesbaniae]